MLTVLWIHPFDMDYRGTSVLRNNAPLGPYSRKMPGALWRPKGGGAVSYERGSPVEALGPARLEASGPRPAPSFGSCRFFVLLA